MIVLFDVFDSCGFRLRRFSVLEEENLHCRHRPAVIHVSNSSFKLERKSFIVEKNENF